MRLNLGAGDVDVPGFTAIDRKLGTEAYPLTAHVDNSVDVIRASHILEHFPQGQALAVLDDWVRALKPGGTLMVAVPDFDWICRTQASGDMDDEQSALLGAVTMGGQTDDNDFHQSVWTRPRLMALMEAVGLECVQDWQSDVKDCASMPLSLNLAGTKPVAGLSPKQEGTPVKVTACMSLPRLCFVDNMFCAIEAFTPLRIPIRRYTGVFWGQCLTNCMEQAIEDGVDYIFSVDYDTVFSPADVNALIQAMIENPHIDALCGVQMKREVDSALLTLRTDDGALRESVALGEFDEDFTRCASAHFGLTIFRAAKLEVLPRPWFVGQPGPDGRWGTGRLDEDMYFWEQWRKVGHTLYQANRVRLGHVQLVVTWPTKTFDPHHQYLNDYTTNGRPEEAEA